MGDVGDVHLRGDGGMERGDAQIIPPPGLARCQEKGKEEWSAGARAARSCRHTMSHWGGGGVCTTLVVGYGWTWASLGFPTGLVRMELRSWSRLEGRGVRCIN